MQVAFGAGARYDFGRDRWFVRGDLDWYDRDAWYAGLSIGLYFGGREPRTVAEPVVVQEAPPPAPVAPPPPPPPPPADSDGDGVIDEQDACPDSAEGARVDVRGCEIKAEIKLPGVQFETDSDVLKTGAALIIEEAAQTLNKHPDLVVEVAGHTDNQGDAAYNQGLSERRAQTVLDFLVSNGVSADRLSWRGYGEAQPIADNNTPEGREQNRRVVLRVLD
ncbi:MAG: OmpA family protein [Gammaproteobacteria bacterium]